jgi:hypothetical protein
MPEPVAVRVRDCACPDAPHADTGDLVYLRPTLSLEGGIAAQQDLIASGGDPSDLTRRWLVTFVRYGVTGANYEPFTIGALLDDFDLAMPVAERADELYGEAVLRPLGVSRSASSRRGPTARSTSPTRRSKSTTPS